MDIASLAGLILGVIMILVGVITGAGLDKLIEEYWNGPSAIITFGGAFSRSEEHTSELQSH